MKFCVCMSTEAQVIDTKMVFFFSVTMTLNLIEPEPNLIPTFPLDSSYPSITFGVFLYKQTKFIVGQGFFIFSLKDFDPERTRTKRNPNLSSLYTEVWCLYRKLENLIEQIVFFIFSHSDLGLCRTSTKCNPSHSLYTRYAFIKFGVSLSKNTHITDRPHDMGNHIKRTCTFIYYPLNFFV